MVGYLDDQKGFKCYNPTTKQAHVSRDVVFDESNEADVPLDEREIGTHEENPISFQLRGPNGRLIRFDQFEQESASSGDSAMHSTRRKPGRRLTRKEKGKKKVSDFDTDRRESDRRESDSEGSGDGSSKAKSASAEKASTSANEQLRRSTR